MTQFQKALLVLLPLAGPHLAAQTLTITGTTVVDVSNRSPRTKLVQFAAGH